jgi:PLP dependent protein
LIDSYKQIAGELGTKKVPLVAVSKMKAVPEIRALYELGQRDFGENYVQELVEKQEQLPDDIRWHFIGHLQTNKVKQIVGFVQLIQAVDSLRLLEEINKQAAKSGRVIDCLLQVFIATEETKFGIDEAELDSLIEGFPGKGLSNVRIRGLMGMASMTDDEEMIRKQFRGLRKMFDRFAELDFLKPDFDTLSMGMSADYKIAIEEGSTMVRIGSLLFGAR